MDLHPAQLKIKIPNKSDELRYQSLSYIMFIVINISLSNFYFGYSLVYISTLEFK